MPDSPKERTSAAKESELVTIPDMPDRLEAAGLKRVGPARIRQLAADDPAFPPPVFERGRMRLWDLSDVLKFFGSRVLRQGERTDLKPKQPQEDPPNDDQRGPGLSNQ
ncbi:hypothetical protein [Streptomyces misionensis]|uniref:hypothetical protein n=1 Tax=Streptomyces misionensis TaxID=67331 RepID=UPI00367FCFDA